MFKAHFQLLSVSATAFLLYGLIGADVAHAYPGGPVVSSGSNPVVSTGGSVVGTSSASLFPIDASADLVVTDVVLGVNDTAVRCSTNFTVWFTLSDGTKLGQFTVGMTRQPRGGGHDYGAWSYQEQVLTLSMRAGMRIPAADQLTIHTLRNYSEECTNAQVNYMVSGYRAQP
jgi:hypothetical protein